MCNNYHVWLHCLIYCGNNVISWLPDCPTFVFVSTYLVRPHQYANLNTLFDPTKASQIFLFKSPMFGMAG